MFSLAHSYTHPGNAGGFRWGISDAEVIWVAGAPYLVTASRPDAGLTIYDIGAAGALQLSDQQVYHNSLQGLSGVRLTPVLLDGQQVILTSGPGHSGLTGYTATSNGGLNSGQMLGATPSGPMAIAQVGLHVFAALEDGGIARFRENSAGDLQFLSTVSPTPAGADPGLTGLLPASAGGTDFLVGISANGDRIDAFGVSSAGALERTSSIGAADGLGINTPTHVEDVILDGKTFVLVGAAGTSTITVLELTGTGNLVPRDHVLDTLQTRFGGLAAMSVIEHDGHVYVAAGGADDGLTLMELLPDGRLVHHVSLADWQFVTLANVSALAGVARADGISIYAASATEAGLTELTVDLGLAGDVLTGSPQNDELTGGPAQDIVVAGSGADTLYGGAGRDLFVFLADTDVDVIADYERGLDLIDLSAWPFFYGPDQLTLIETPSGAALYFSDFQITLHSHDGNTLGMADLRFETALNHVSTGYEAGGSAQGGQNILGTAGADMLRGDVSDDLLKGLDGNDTLHGGLGADRLDGGAGKDLVSYQNADGRVLVDLLQDASTVPYARFYDHGAPEGDIFEAVEDGLGGGFSDQFRGDNGANVLDGDNGWDRLYGRQGDDTLIGGKGGDMLYGNHGADTMTGGTTGQRDRFIYFRDTDSGVGAGNRDVITDFQSGVDRIEISRIDADITQNLKQPFDFIGATAFSNTAGELRYEQSAGATIVQADFDGDGAADFEIELTGQLSLQVVDFML